MSKADIFVALVLLTFTYLGMRWGLFKSLLKMLSTTVSLLLSMVLYPSVTFALRNTPLFDKLKELIIKNLGLNEMVFDATKQGERQLIEALPLPDNIIDKLAENNNSTVYSILDAENIVDYIGGFIANIALNVLVIAGLFLVLLIVMRLCLKILGLVEKIALIRTAGKAGGGIIGICMGVIVIWTVFLCLNLFMSEPDFNKIIGDIRMSYIASIFYKYNLIEAYFYSKGML